MTLFLTREQIIECTGVQHFEQLVEMEILFNSFDEFASLEGCTNLKRLSCIDNGLKRISNLQPLAMSLTSLCLCDQGLTAMDNLILPNLRELFLHRNEITKIGNLAGCPRLRKLWLFQNKIEVVSGLHAVPELEDCWLQSNQITKLQGFETLTQLQHLGLAGNSIVDFKELKRLSVCTALRSVSCSDIHFGRCPIADEAGYQEFIVLHLPQVTTLDGIAVTKETQLSAEDIYYAQLRSFNSSLVEVEQAYQQSLQNIEAQYQSRESYSNVLEKEMSAALKELQGLVSEGRGVIAHQVQRNQQLLSANAVTLTRNLEDLEAQAKVALRDQLGGIHEEFDSSAALLSVLEQVTLADSELITILCDVSATSSGSHPNSNEPSEGKNKKSKTREAKNTQSNTSLLLSTNTAESARKVLFQAISNNTADFQMLSSYIAPTYTLSANGVNDGVKNKKAGKNASGAVTLEGEYKAVRNLDRLEVARLYKIALQPVLGYSQTAVSAGLSPMSAGTSSDPSAQQQQQQQQQVYTESGQYQRVFTALLPDELRLVLLHGWEALQVAPVFSSDADIIATLYGTVNVHMNHTLPEEYASVLQAEGVDDNALLHMKNSTEGTSLNTRADAHGQGAHGKKSNAEKLTKLHAAMNSKLYLLVCCKLYTEKVNFGIPGSTAEASSAAVSSMQLPHDVDLRRQLMSEFLKARRPQKVSLQFKAGAGSAAADYSQPVIHPADTPLRPHSLLYLLPARLCVDAVSLDFAALCVSPPVEGGGLRSVDHRIEPLVLPVNHAEHSGYILSTFEKKAAEQVRLYCDKLLEEVDEAQAAALRQAENDVSYREGSLKNMREEVEKERRGQDALLREMRQLALNGDQSSGNNSPGPQQQGMAHSFSNTNMQSQYGQASNPKPAPRGSKR